MGKQQVTQLWVIFMLGRLPRTGTPSFTFEERDSLYRSQALPLDILFDPVKWFEADRVYHLLGWHRHNNIAWFQEHLHERLSICVIKDRISRSLRLDPKSMVCWLPIGFYLDKSALIVTSNFHLWIGFLKLAKVLLGDM